MRTFTRLTSAVLLTAMSFTSCNQETITDPETIVVNVRINDFQIETSSIGSTRASDKTATQAGIKNITLTAFNQSGVEAATVTQTSTDTDFGIIKMALPAGTYSLVAVAHSGTKQTTIISAKSASQESEDNVHIYTCTQEETISATAANNITLSMGKRKNAVFGVKITDDTPADAKAIRITVNPTAESPTTLAYSPTTGFATTSWQYTQLISKSQAGGTFTNTTLQVPLLLTSATQQLNVKIEAFKSDGDVLKSKTLTGVTFKQSECTTATGIFFTPIAIDSFQFDTEVDETTISLD